MRRAGGTRHRARRTGAQWRERVERFERSGQTRGKFCAAHELALTTFDLCGVASSARRQRRSRKTSAERLSWS